MFFSSYFAWYAKPHFLLESDVIYSPSSNLKFKGRQMSKTTNIPRPVHPGQSLKIHPLAQAINEAIQGANRQWEYERRYEQMQKQMQERMAEFQTQISAQTTAAEVAEITAALEAADAQFDGSDPEDRTFRIPHTDVEVLTAARAAVESGEPLWVDTTEGRYVVSHVEIKSEGDGEESVEFTYRSKVAMPAKTDGPQFSFVEGDSQPVADTFKFWADQAASAEDIEVIEGHFDDGRSEAPSDQTTAAVEVPPSADIAAPEAVSTPQAPDPSKTHRFIDSNGTTRELRNGQWVRVSEEELAVESTASPDPVAVAWDALPEFEICDDHIAPEGYINREPTDGRIHDEDIEAYHQRERDFDAARATETEVNLTRSDVLESDN